MLVKDLISKLQKIGDKDQEVVMVSGSNNELFDLSDVKEVRPVSKCDEKMVLIF